MRSASLASIALFLSGLVFTALAQPQVPPDELPKAMQEALSRPMTEREVLELMSVLESPLAEKSTFVTEGSRRGLPGFARGLSPERMDVLLDDVEVLLADLHAAETLTQMKGMAGLTPERRLWLEGSLGAIHACAPPRFEGRGGPAAYADSLRIVQKFRFRLEPLVLDALQRGFVEEFGVPKPKRSAEPR